MNNLLRITLLGFFLSMGLLSCGKDGTPSKDKGQGQVEEDGSLNNDKPGGGKYVEVELASAEPDWNNIKVGDTVTLKFKVIAPFDESKNERNRMLVDQAVDKGTSTGNMNAEISVGPVSASDIKGTIQSGTSSIVSDKSTTDPVYMQVAIKPNYALPTTIKIVVTILNGADDVKHSSKIFTYNFTPKN